MFDQADVEVCAWIAAIVGSGEIILDWPPEHPEGRGVSVYLIDILPDLPAREGGPAPLQVRLRYLVSTWAETPQQAHGLLGELVFATLDHPRYTADLGPLTEVWGARGLPPRPAFLLCVPVRRERTARPAPPVREPLAVDTAPLGPLHGVVLGTGAIPVAGARVEYLALQRAVTTDAQGRFRFEAVPATATPRALRVTARGRTFNVTLGPSAAADEPVQIHVATLEES